jgi:protein gp37
MRFGGGLEFKPGHLKNGNVELYLDEEALLQPLRWKRHRKIFICSTTDLFADFVPDEWIDKHLAMMALAPQHFFLVLTKRAQRMREYMLTAKNRVGTMSFVNALRGTGFLDSESIRNPESREWPLSNVGFGVSVENQDAASDRIPELLRFPAALHFISAEPLLGPLNLTEIPVPDDCAGKYAGHGFTFNALQSEDDLTLFNSPNHIGLVIAGGESGSCARPTHPDWFRGLLYQCRESNTPFNLKQNGEWVSCSEVAGPGQHFSFPDGATVRRAGKKLAGRTLDGVIWDQMPEMCA